MLKKTIVIGLVLMMAGALMANPIKTDSRWTNRCDEPYNNQSLTHEIPAGGTPVTDEELEPVGVKHQIPEAPTPVCEWLWFMLRVTRWAD